MEDDTRFDSDYVRMQRFKRKYGRKYRLAPDRTVDGETIGYSILTLFDPSRKAENGEFPHCVWEYSDTHLMALIPSRTAKKILKKHSFVKRDLLTDEGTQILFPADKLDILADDLRLRRKRRLSPEHREKLVSAGRKHQFLAGSERP